MTAASYVVGITSLIAGVLFVLHPEIHEPSPSGSWWGSLSQWITHSYPSPTDGSLFGLSRDVNLRVGHSFTRGDGFHRQYQLRIDFSRERAGANWADCCVAADWSLPKDLIIDHWMLDRASANTKPRITWKFDEKPLDLEAPVYSKSALPFSLRATVPLCDTKDSGTILVDIPDISVRYQEPSLTHNRSPKILLYPPKISFQCPDRPSSARVEEEAPQHFRPLDFAVPIAAPSTLIYNLTFSIIAMSVLYLLYQLYKA